MAATAAQQTLVWLACLVLFMATGCAAGLYLSHVFNNVPWSVKRQRRTQAAARASGGRFVVDLHRVYTLSDDDRQQGE